MRTASDPEMAVESTGSVTEPTLLDHWRFERRLTESKPTSDWRSAVPAELFERLRALSAAAAVPSPAPFVVLPTPAPQRVEADQAAEAALPFSYRAPFLPEIVKEPENVVETLGWDTPSELLPEEPEIPVRVPNAFLGLDWSTADDTDRVLVSLRPVLSADLADKVVELLDRAPGMYNVKSLGSDGDVAAFEAEYRGPVVAMEAVNQALRGIGASLVSSGDREFYLAIQGQAV